VKVTVYGSEYAFLTDGDPEDVIAVAEKVNGNINAILQANKGTSLNRVLVYAAMDAEDRAMQALRTAEQLQAQLREHLAETARCRSEAERLRAELQQKEAKVLELTAALATRGTSRTPAPKDEDLAEQTRLELPTGRGGGFVRTDADVVTYEHDEPEEAPMKKGTDKVGLSPDDFIHMIDNLSKASENGEKE